MLKNVAFWILREAYERDTMKSQRKNRECKMEGLPLYKTLRLLQQKRAQNEFGSYAVYVKIGERETTLLSPDVNEDTYFDIASCGKVLVTAPLTLQAIDRGLLRLDTTLAELFDDVPEDKRAITVKQLLSHTSGIVRAEFSAEIATRGKQAIIKQILSHPLAFAPDSDYVYSCSGMLLLGYIVENVYGDTLENVFEKNIKKPLGYTRSCFNVSIKEENMVNCLHTEDACGFPCPWDDEIVRVLGTSAGAGGQFFTMKDLKTYAKAILSKNPVLYGENLFAEAECVQSPSKATESRGLGWLYVDEKYHQTGKLFENGSFGHCGHTGQSIFFHRKRNLCVILLTNANRYRKMNNGWKSGGYEYVEQMRQQVHNTILEDLQDCKLW